MNAVERIARFAHTRTRSVLFGCEVISSDENSAVAVFARIIILHIPRYIFHKSIYYKQTIPAETSYHTLICSVFKYYGYISVFSITELRNNMYIYIDSCLFSIWHSLIIETCHTAFEFKGWRNNIVGYWNGKYGNEN